MNAYKIYRAQQIKKISLFKYNKSFRNYKKLTKKESYKSKIWLKTL